ncbi:MAG: PD-(D/E)XK nuclease family protein [Vicinamibacterales bacterium]
MTPRRSCLHRAADLEGFRRAVAGLVAEAQPFAARDMVVVVQTRAAAAELRRTLEHLAWRDGVRALCLPHIGTRADLLDTLAGRLSRRPDRLSPFDREVLLARAARAAAAGGAPPPFVLRPGLVAEMLALYDTLRRQLRTVARFEEFLSDELAGSDDRGAVRMLAETRFLAEAFRGYEAGAAASGRLDEHALRDRLLGDEAPRPVRRVVVTVTDRVSDPAGLWPSDLDLLTRLPGMTHLDLVATEGVLGAGWLERLHRELPGIDERVVPSGDHARPTCLVPSADEWVFVSRDREEELAALARRLKAERRAGRLQPGARIAVVVRRPLPYLYLARDVLGRAGIPYETRDTLPLAAEPFAAALDLVFEWVATGFARASTVALLRSPHFHFEVDGRPVAGAEVDALDRALGDARYLGDADRLAGLVEAWSALPDRRRHEHARRALPAARAAAASALRLKPLADERPVAAHIATLDDFLAAHLRGPDRDDPLHEREARVRAAVIAACRALAAAYAAFDPDARLDLATVAASVRRWLGSQTFAPATGDGGVHLVDAATAPYGLYDEVQVVGLVDGDWPERERRSIFYPPFLLHALGWPDERQRLEGARAAFLDLLALARDRFALSTIRLEDDAVVEPSAFLHEVRALAPPRQVADSGAGVRIFPWEALALDPPIPDVFEGDAREWASLRLARTSGADAAFHGEAGPWLLPRVSVSRLERYLDCPFKFYASQVLGLAEPPADEDGPTPLERGLFLHELFERFFAEWKASGHGAITVETLDEARRLFDAVAGRALATLPQGEAAIERLRLFGTPGAPGIARRVLTMEVERGGAVVDRLLEYPIEGAFTFEAADGRARTLTLRGKVDRIDLLGDGTFHLIDYKTRGVPDPKRALQLPIYSVCVEARLQGHGGRGWQPGDARYLSYEGPEAVVPLTKKPSELPGRLVEAQGRLLDVLDDIGAGHFPPRPVERSLCGYCAFAAVCRKDYVGEPAASVPEPAAPGDPSDG